MLQRERGSVSRLCKGYLVLIGQLVPTWEPGLAVAVGCQPCTCCGAPCSPLLPSRTPQIGSCTSQMGQIAIVSFQNSSPKVIECFNVESRVLCMVYVPAEDRPREPESTGGRVLGIPTVCLGTEEGR